MTSPSERTFRITLKSEWRKSFYEGHKPIAVFMIVLVFLSPIVGVFVMGLTGAVLGMAISVVAYYLTPYAVLKLREK